MSNPEAISKNPEKNIDSNELEAINDKQREALRDALEKKEKQHGTTSKEVSSEDIKNEALIQAENNDLKNARLERSPAEKRSKLITKNHRQQSFDKQMDTIQPHLSRSEQKFSKIIHHKTIESTSDTLGETIARPNALLSGSICAFLLVTAVYLLAKHYGYTLSGFETIGAFALGWTIGLIYDYIRLLIRGKKSN